MSPFPNPATQFKAGENAVSMAHRGARKGGLSTSPAKTIAAKLRWLKKKAGLGEVTAQELFEVMTDADLNALDQRIFLQQIRTLTYVNKEGKTVSALSPRDKIELSRAMMEWTKLYHGTKEHNETTINVGDIRNYRFVIVENGQEHEPLPAQVVDAVTLIEEPKDINIPQLRTQEPVENPELCGIKENKNHQGQG